MRTTQTHNHPDRLLTVGAVAERLQISTRAVWALAARGELPALKLGTRTTRWRERDVQRFIERAAAGAAR